jgi:hypothetical protein
MLVHIQHHAHCVPDFPRPLSFNLVAPLAEHPVLHQPTTVFQLTQERYPGLLRESHKSERTRPRSALVRWDKANETHSSDGVSEVRR